MYLSIYIFIVFFCIYFVLFCDFVQRLYYLHLSKFKQIKLLGAVRFFVIPSQLTLLSPHF